MDETRITDAPRDRSVTGYNRGEELRQLKLSTSKGIGILTACMVGMLTIIATVFWLAMGLAPTAEDSRNVFQKTPERPLGALTHPRDPTSAQGK